MSVWAGIDMGTSGIKVALFDDGESLLAAASRRIEVQRLHPGWSEQSPAMWWDNVAACFDELAADQPGLMARLAGIGLSGQMLGLVLLDETHAPLRPAMLWNDQRALAECDELLRRVPDIGRRADGAPDPGLIGPKLIWMARHEPDILARARMLLLPKDFVRLQLTGTILSEPTDGGGTMLMDNASSTWDPELCRALDWDMARLPEMVNPWDEAGQLRADLAARWGTPARVAVAAGTGDNMACTIGVGAAKPGDVVITIGTSGVVNAVDGAFHPAPEAAVLTAPHAAPAAFISMGVVMSATASLDWLANLTGSSAAALAGEAEHYGSGGNWDSAPLMRPSLSGIRTPHNRPDVAGLIDGITLTSDRAAMAFAVMEGVAYQVADCAAAQQRAGVAFDNIRLVGGGSRSKLWGEMIATLLNKPITVPDGAALAANLGAARLGRIAAGGAETDLLARPLPIAAEWQARDEWRTRLQDRLALWRELPMIAAPSLRKQKSS
ncbi:MAG: xylulokinase [Hyphomicrobiales bacterium]|nr:MAG: xylulokinase [Hyphomicrobiales bacterium]